MNQVSDSQSITHKEGRELIHLGHVLLFMPTLSACAVSVTVGGRGSAIIDWKIYVYIH